MEIRLVVIRTKDQSRLADFYSLLGLKFDYHKHGNSPMHYSATIGSLVFEIYPLTKSQTEEDCSTRLGFAIDNFEQTLNLLKTNGIPFSEPVQTDFGFLTIVSDPDGRKIELYKK
ncbi:VOC family protein [Flavobacterium foetidum]|uniref:VOC family protein n=1 Tax=Flavobacterium foetidum TaxID=2026681 RepID=UPI001074F84C|nr:VOC family protein [Flavobacterium foetidum]KAF2513405.1 glyoxalase/bleomycin resistance/extradiol dioxygenase family protein [Flavobacterium foetidum]